MKPSILSLVALAIGLTAAQSVDGVPDCAKPCVLKYTTGNAIAGCKGGNVKCICQNQDFLSGIACCLEGACDQAGKDAAVKFAQQICSTAGVTVPDEVVCNNSTSTESAAESSSAAAETQTGSETQSATGTAATNNAASSTAAAVSTSTSPAAAAGLSGAGASGVVGAILAMMMAL